MSSDWALPPPTSPAPFTRLEPLDTLYAVGGESWIFTCAAPSGLVLAFLVEEVEGASVDLLRRFIAAPTSLNDIASLRLGTLSVRDALTRSWLWVVDVRDSGEVEAVYSVQEGQLPVDVLPDRSVMLLASLQPALALRFSGPEIVPGQVPASVVARAGSSASRALGKLATFVAAGVTAELGRPPEWLRRMYNLPVQRLGYGSLEISFRLPSEVDGFQSDMGLSHEDEESLVSASEISDRIWRMLRAGLEWVDSGVDGEFRGVGRADDREQLAILEALKELIPNTPVVTSVAISGRHVGAPARGATYLLGRKQADAVRSRYREVRSRVEGATVLSVFNGLIRDLDLDKRTFILRVPERLAETGERFVFGDEELLVVARDAHYGDLRVSVVGRRSRDLTNEPWEATAIEIGDVVGE